MTKAQALAEILEKLGGGAPDSPVGGEEAILSEIAGTLRGDGIELPEVTAEDNGDVLTVVSGKWNKAEPDKGLPTIESGDQGKVLTAVGNLWQAAAPTFYGALVKFDSTWDKTNHTVTTTIGGYDNPAVLLWNYLIENGLVVLENTSSKAEKLLVIGGANESEVFKFVALGYEFTDSLTVEAGLAWVARANYSDSSIVFSKMY